MSDRIPGTSYDNPIHYRGYRIYLNDCGPWAGHHYAFSHEDYDGAPVNSGDGPADYRCGYARTVEDAKAEIDEQIEDMAA